MLISTILVILFFIGLFILSRKPVRPYKYVFVTYKGKKRLRVKNVLGGWFEPSYKLPYYDDLFDSIAVYEDA